MRKNGISEAQCAQSKFIGIGILFAAYLVVFKASQANSKKIYR
jgi:hypothetical protein